MPFASCATLPVNQMVSLAAADAERPLLPYLAADALYAACRYDVSAGSVAVNAVVTDPAGRFHCTPPGRQFLCAAGPTSATHRRDVRDRAGQRASGGFRVVAAPRHGRLAVESPVQEGLVLVRAPLRGLAWRADTEAKLRRTACAPVPQALAPRSCLGRHANTVVCTYNVDVAPIDEDMERLQTSRRHAAVRPCPRRFDLVGNSNRSRLGRTLSRRRDLCGSAWSSRRTPGKMMISALRG